MTNEPDFTYSTRRDGELDITIHGLDVAHVKFLHMILERGAAHCAQDPEWCHLLDHLDDTIAEFQMALSLSIKARHSFDLHVSIADLTDA